ncbi:MAG: NADH-quinone oxidoreductase subunit K [Hyphomonadaceae bacterium]
MDAIEIAGRAHYALIAVLAGVGFAAAAAARDLGRRILGLAIVWTAVALFFVSLGYVAGAAAPTAPAQGIARGVLFANPLPQAAALLAAPVCAASLLLGYALLVRVREAYGAIDARTIAEADRAQEAERAQ